MYTIVERFNRTLKEKMFKEFTVRGTHNWLIILPELMDNYHNTRHRTIAMTPIQSDNNPSIVVLNRRNIPVRKNKFRVGDSVRISTHKGAFTKGYLPNWSSDEIFTIEKINKTLPVTYMLKDYTGNSIAGCFYAEEIHKTAFTNDYLVEKVVRTKGQKVFVKWLGFDNTHNSWINKSEIKK